MPTRLFRHGILNSDVIDRIRDDPAECLYVRLVIASDDYGRLDGRISIVKAECYPITPVSLEELERRLQHLAGLYRDDGSPLVQLYYAGPRRYISIPKHGQRMRAVKSTCPDPPPFDQRVPAALELPAGVGPPPSAPAQQPAQPGAHPTPDPAIHKRAEVRAIARIAIEYLNTVAGTAYRIVEGNLQWPMARIDEGASEADLKAVIDAKAAEVLKGEFSAKYMRPETLFNRSKFNSYIGQVSMTPPKPVNGSAPAMIRVHAWADDPEKSIQLTEYPLVGEPKAEMVAKRAASEFGRMISGRGLKKISVVLPGNSFVAVFSIGELKS